MLKRLRILVTRAPHQASELADRLRALGAEPVMIPTIEIAEPTSFAALDKAVAEISGFDWVVFTSANAVAPFASRLPRHGRLPRMASIGPATSRALQSAGIAVDIVPPQAVAESLAQALAPHAGAARFLLVRAEKARDHLPEALTAAGGEVVDAPAYRNVVPPGSADALRVLFAAEPPDAVTFTSSSSARNFFELLAEAGLALPPQVARASIGPVTSATLRELGYPPHTEADDSFVRALAEKTVAYLKL